MKLEGSKTTGPTVPSLLQTTISGDSLSAKLLASILDSLTEAIIILDEKSKVIYANASYARIMEVPINEILGRNMTDFAPESFCVEVMQTGRPIVNERRRTTLMNIDVIADAFPIYHDGQLLCVLGVARDTAYVAVLSDKLRQITAEARRLRRQVITSGMTWQSNEMRTVMQMVDRVARLDATVLITGESGVGKTVLARTIHECGSRRNAPFVNVNCGAIPGQLLESELFGYDAGAFTGAKKTGKLGLFALASGGTILLDEVGELPLELQVKLLQVIQERKIRRIGSTKSTGIDTRIIAATNQDLEQMVQQGKFRKDLYYRLRVIPIEVPPLRDRRADIIPLAVRTVDEVCEKYGIENKLALDVLRLLEKCDWPGNVRELENFLERLLLLSPGPIVTMGDVRDILGPEFLSANSHNTESLSASENETLDELLQRVERKAIEKALEKHSSVRRAAHHLGMNHVTLLRRMQKYGMKLSRGSNQ